MYRTKKVPYKKDDLRILESLLKAASKPTRTVGAASPAAEIIRALLRPRTEKGSV